MARNPNPHNINKDERRKRQQEENPETAKALDGESPTINCPECNRNLHPRNYFTINKNSEAHKLYAGTGRIPICKDCIKKRSVNENGTPNMDGIKWCCKWFDIPFLQSLVLTYMQQDKWSIGYYKKNIVLNSKYRTWTYEDGERYASDGIDKNNPIDTKQKTDAFNFEDEEESDFEVTRTMVKFWGRGYEKEDYEFLETCFYEWTTQYKCDTLAEKKTYKFLSLKELEINKGRERKDNIDKLEESFRKLMSDANVTPRDANAANDPENMNSLGVWIKDIERYKPAEYFEDKKLYDDFDGIKDYLERFVFRPLKNLLTGSRDFDKEYNVESDNEYVENEEDISENEEETIEDTSNKDGEK